MKIVKGWRRIDNERGFINETTGQNLVVKKKQFGQHFIVMLFQSMDSSEEGTKISPEYPTEEKADVFARDWMSKNPRGTEQNLQGQS